MSAARPSHLRFGEFEIDLGREELRRNGAPVRLQAQPTRLLALLAGRAGELVTREEIRTRLWGDQTFVDFEQSINHCVRLIRIALGDDADASRFIQTIPRRGYRFLAEVDAGDLPAPAPEIALSTGTPFRPPGGWTAAGGIAFGLLLLVLVAAWARQHAGNGMPGRAKNPMLAILPFRDLGLESRNASLGESFTEELITELGRRYSGRLGVIARTSVARCGDSTRGASEIGTELGVNYVLEGSVQRAGNRVRISAQLIRAPDQVHLWTGAYDREIVDLLDIQKDVGEKITGALALKILPANDRFLPAASTSPEVYDLYLEGRRFLRQESSSSPDLSLASFRRAIELDPAFAPAYVGLAMAHSHRGVPPRESWPDAREAALKALALDDSLADAHLILAQIIFYYDLDPESSREEFERAIRINSSFAEAHHAYAAYFSIEGRHDLALAQVQMARALDPLSPMVNADIGWYYYFARRYDEAIEHSRRTLRMSPAFYWANRCILLSILQKGDLPAAIAQAKTEMREAGASALETAKLDALPPAAAIRAYWIWDLERRQIGSRPRSPADIAMIHLALGESDRALAALEKAYEERFGWSLPFLRVEPMVDPLRNDPRFRNLLARIERHSKRVVVATDATGLQRRSSTAVTTADQGQ